jgi:iron(III) transport system permease protein
VGAVSSLRSIQGKTVVIAATIGILIYLIIGPLAMLLISSFKSTQGRLPFESGTPFTLENYSSLLLNPYTYNLLFTTLGFAVGSLLVAFFFSIALAFLVERTNLPLRNLVFVLILASSALPGVIWGIAWLLLLNPTNGWFNVAARALAGTADTTGPIDVFTLPGLIMVQGITLVPLSFLLISASFRAMNASYEEAGSTSGARYSTVLRRVTLPLMAPAILSALVYQFVTAIESFDIPLIIGLRGGIRLLSTQIYLDVYPANALPDYGGASAYGLLLLALAVVPLVVYNRVVTGSPERFATVTGHSFRARQIDLGRAKYVAATFTFGYLFVTFGLPFVVMLWMSVQPFYSVPSAESVRRITLDAYQTIWADRRTLAAFGNTLLLGLCAGLGAMIISFLTAWIIVRTRTRFKTLLDLLAFAPHAFPGVIIGLSIALIYLFLPFPIYGTIWIIVIALTTQYISLGTRLMTGGIAQIHSQLEEAAAVSGAAWHQAMVKILLPLVLPAFINGFLLVFLASIKNLTLSLMLYTSNSVVLSTLIWGRWDRGDTAETAVLGVIMSAGTIVLALLLRKYGYQAQYK